MSVRYSSPLNSTWWSDLGWVMVYVHSPTGAMPSLVARGGSRFSSCKYFRGKWTRSPRTPFSSCRAWSRSVSHRRSLLEFSFSSCTFLTPSRGRQLKTWTNRRTNRRTNVWSIFMIQKTHSASMDSTVLRLIWPVNIFIYYIEFTLTKQRNAEFYNSILETVRK